MPEYLFRNAAGEERSEFYEAAYAPRCGTEVDLEGEIWTRVPSVGSVMAKQEINFTSMQIAPFHPAAPRVNAHGEAQFRSRKEIREFEAATGDAGTGEGLKYDEL